jgi:Protein of unknown function (DUF4058)
MPSAFPGVDPFLEAQGYWEEFHWKYINYLPEALAEQIPDDYEVRIEERLSLVYEPDPAPRRKILPDVAVLRSSGASRTKPAPSGTATLEPVVLALPRYQLEEVSEPRIEIRRFPNRELITAIELLSPSNKQPPGDRLYYRMRLELLNQQVHLVELVFLIGGERLPMEDELPKGHYYALVSRAERRFYAETYVWTIRDPLPPIPIPLKTPDPDILLDLAAVFARVYQGARYERSIDYAATLDLPLSQEDRAWAESLARSTRPPQARR